MFGMIAKLEAAPECRDAVMELLSGIACLMPGCLSYIVARDSADENTLWVTEAWDSKGSHDASLSLPAVQNAITAAKPLIARFERIAVTEPMGGHGLSDVIP